MEADWQNIENARTVLVLMSMHGEISRRFLSLSKREVGDSFP